MLWAPITAPGTLVSRSTSLTDGTCGVCVSLVPTMSPVASPGAGTQQGVPEGSAERMRGGVSADGGNAGTHEAVGRSPPSTEGQTEVQRGKALTFSCSGPEGGCVGSGGELGLSADFRRVWAPDGTPLAPPRGRGRGCCSLRSLHAPSASGQPAALPHLGQHSCTARSSVTHCSARNAPIQAAEMPVLPGEQATARNKPRPSFLLRSPRSTARTPTGGPAEPRQPFWGGAVQELRRGSGQRASGPGA